MDTVNTERDMCQRCLNAFNADNALGMLIAQIPYTNCDLTHYKSEEYCISARLANNCAINEEVKSAISCNC